MNRSLKTKVAAGVALGAAVAAAGGAVAATRASSPKEESRAIVADAAQRLGVTPAALTEALQGALQARVDAAVADGRLTREQGDALKERIRAGDAPLVGVPHRFGRHGHFGGLAAAARYLEVGEAELRSALRDGNTLAQVARERGKSVDGLVDALVADAEQRLGEAVAAGRLTEAQKERVVERLRERIAARVNGERGGPRFGFGLRRMDGPPPFGAPGARAEVPAAELPPAS